MTKTFLLFLTLVVATGCRPASAQQSFRVMSYNVENLFDTEDNPQTNDNDFLPSGNRRWTKGRYYRKLRQIAKVISAAGEWEMPALVGLCEVENDSVLQHLLRRTPLKQSFYHYCMTHGSDSRGINVALLYQPDRFGYAGHKEYPVVFTQKKHKTTRNLLHVWGRITETDTLDIVVCHLPSRYGGEKESEGSRLDAIRTLRRVCDSLLAVRETPRLLIMGDFNDTPENASLREVLRAGSIPRRPQADRLYNLFGEAKDAGSHKFQGEWSQLDHIIVSGNMVEGDASIRLVAGSNRVFAPPFLLVEDKTWTDERTFRTFYGFRYEGGFSDHLPLIADFLLLK